MSETDFLILIMNSTDWLFIIHPQLDYNKNESCQLFIFLADWNEICLSSWTPGVCLEGSWKREEPRGAEAKVI